MHQKPFGGRSLHGPKLAAQLRPPIWMGLLRKKKKDETRREEKRKKGEKTTV